VHDGGDLITRWWSELLHDLTRLDLSRFDPVTGLRAAAFVLTPLVVGAFTGNLLSGLFGTVGANFLTNTEGEGSNATRAGVLAAACFIEPVALALGTLAASTGPLAVPLVALGVFSLLMSRTSPSWSQVGLISTVVFVVGAGLPGGSPSQAAERFLGATAGDIWALIGIWFQRRWAAGARGGSDRVDLAPESSRHAHPFVSDLSLRSEAVRQAATTGIAVAVGLSVGLALNLPRDIWILITIVIAIRHGIGPTVNSTVVLVVGTVIGAALAGILTLEVSNLYVLMVFLFVFAFGMFASRLVSQALLQVFVTPFLIVLLNIVFSGGWQYAVYRVIDVAVGGGVAIAAVYVLCLELNLTRRE
jgi:hypothetical protein